MTTDVELAQATFRIQKLKAQIAELTERNLILSNQLRGGTRDVDPRTCEDHPGHVLIELGWAYCPDEEGEPDDEIGAYWHDPTERGTGKYSVMPLTTALAIACRRLAGLRTEKGRGKSWLERVGEDDG
jgi:hypothetical protein